MSDANLASIAFGPESTLGAPVTTLQEIRFTKENLKFEKESVSSAEIRSDRQVSDNQKVHGQTTGGFDFELSFLFILHWLAAALQNEWLLIDITATADLTHTTQLVEAADGTFDGVPIGALVVISGAATTANNGPKRVIDKATDGSTLTLAVGSLTASETATLTFTGKSLCNGTTRKSQLIEKRLLNGEGEDFYQRFAGMVVDTLDLKIESKALIKGTINMVGTRYELGDQGIDAGALDPVAASQILTFTDNALDGEQVEIGGTTYTFVTAAAAPGEVTIGVSEGDSILALEAEIMGLGIGDTNPLVTAAGGMGTLTVTAIIPGALGNAITTTTTLTNATWGGSTLAGGVTQAAGYSRAELGPVMNGTNNMGVIRMDGQVATDRFKAISLNIANNLRGKDACGFEGNWDIGSGQFKVTGNLNAYFRNNQLPTKIKNHTTFSLEFNVVDADGNTLYFYMPSVKPANGDPAITGINTDVMIDTSYEAIRGGAENPTGKTLWIDAIAAP